MQDSIRYEAFISYSHADRSWARWLHRNLESYRTPRYLIGRKSLNGRTVPGKLGRVFRDREELASSPDLSARIQEALEASRNLIVICSPTAARSRWVNREIEAFQELGRSERIFAFVVDGDPGEPGSDRDCFPPALRQLVAGHGRDGRHYAEPIAADARRNGDGRYGARLKLIAGLLDVGLDDLRQREAQRRHRRMAVVTASSLVAVVATSWLAIDAMLAREEANNRRTQAENLLGFMVGDLRDRLEPIGRLDLLEEVGNQAMEYFRTVSIADLSDTELRRQAQVMTQLGEIRFSELQYEEALASFTGSYERAEALYRDRPDDGDRLFERAQAEFWIAYVYWRSGNFEAARDWMIRYRDSSLELLSIDPERADWVQEVAFGYHNLAVLDQESGNLDAALAGFRQELDTLYELQRRNESFSRRYDISDAISWLGSIALQQGDLVDALDYFEQSAEESTALAREDPDNREWEYNRAYALLRVAQVAAVIGELDKARSILFDIQSAFDTLAGHDPDNLEWQRASAKPLILYGNILASAGESDTARELSLEAIDRLARLVEVGLTDLYVAEDLADAYMLLGWTEQIRGDVPAAVDAVDQALESLQKIDDAGPLNEQRRGKYASAVILRGELEQALDDAAGAEAFWGRASSLLESQADEMQSHFLLDPWSRLLFLTGREEEASRTRGALEARRYVPLKPWSDVYR